MLAKGTRVKVWSSGGYLRRGYVEFADSVGYTVRLDSGGSLFFQSKRVPKGSCYNSGGYSMERDSE